MSAAIPFEVVVRSVQNAPVVGSLGALLGLLVVGVLSSYILISLVAHTPRSETASEKSYRTVTRDGEITGALRLPDSYAVSEAEVCVSVVVPAYNEAERLPGMLDEAITLLHDRFSAAKGRKAGANGDAAKHHGMEVGWEMLIVDDGSTDSTAETALDWARSRIGLGKFEEGQIRVCVLEKNRGKGGAVTHGMRHVRGKYAIFADADGASKFEDLMVLMKEMKGIEDDGFGVAVGSRAHMVTTDAVVKRSFVRNLLMHSFHALLKTFGIRHIHDTQCGFKLFSRAAIKSIFPYMHTEGWIFDIEILLLAGYKGIPMVEVPITWHEVTGTKMRLVQDSIRMAWDLGVVRLGYLWGIYIIGGGGPSKKKALRFQEREKH